MKLLNFLIPMLILVAPCDAAISILIQPDSSGNSVFTITETAPNPLLDISGVSGYALGMELPTSMFNIPGLGGGFSSDITGDLTASVGTITEVFSNRSFLLNRLKVSSESSPSLLYFDPIYLTGSGFPSARFALASSGPVATNIGYEALNPGVHSINSVLFGMVTVTVVPEPSVVMLLFGAVVPALLRRRGPSL